MPRPLLICTSAFMPSSKSESFGVPRQYVALAPTPTTRDGASNTCRQVRKLFGEHATFSHEVRTGTLPPPATDDEVTEDAKEDDARGAQDLIDFVHGIAIKSNFQVLSQDVFEFAIQAEFVCRSRPPRHPHRHHQSQYNNP